MNYKSALFPPLLGFLIAAGLAMTTALSVAIGLGALTTIFTVLLFKTDRDYALTGTLFLLAVGLSLWYLPVSETSVGLTRITLVVLGSLSGLFLLAKRFIKYLIRTIERRYSKNDTFAEIWDIGSSLGSSAYIL